MELQNNAQQNTEQSNKNFLKHLHDMYNCQPQEIVFMSESQLERLTKY